MLEHFKAGWCNDCCSNHFLLNISPFVIPSVSDLALESNPSDHPRASTIFLSKSQTDGKLRFFSNLKKAERKTGKITAYFNYTAQEHLNCFNSFKAEVATKKELRSYFISTSFCSLYSCFLFQALRIC